MDTVNEAKSQHSMPSEVDTELVEPELTGRKPWNRIPWRPKHRKWKRLQMKSKRLLMRSKQQKLKRHDDSNYHPNDKRVNYKLTETNPHTAALNY